jgi:hypothetical protein
MHSIGYQVARYFIAGQAPANRTWRTVMQLRHRIHEMRHVMSPSGKSSIQCLDISTSVTEGNYPAATHKLLNEFNAAIHLGCNCHQANCASYLRRRQSIEVW